MDWLTHMASAKALKRWKAERQADDSWQNRNQRLYIVSEGIPATLKVKRQEVKKRFLLRTNGVQAKTKTNPKLEVTCHASISQKKDIMSMSTSVCRL